MASKERKASKKAEEVEQEATSSEGDEEGQAIARATSALERRARMRERRVTAPAHDPHETAGHAHDGHAHGHDHHEDDEVDTSNDPSWWVPHTVLGALVLIGILGFFGLFNGAAAKLGYKGMPGLAAAPHETQSAPASKPAEPKQQPEARPTPPQLPTPKETFGAKHLLVMYKGSMRAPAEISRTKDEAKARAEEALKKAKAGTKFEDLVKEYSDEPGAGARGGDLGTFPKGRMVGAFQDGLEKTKVGEISDLVETPFGYHVILRTK